MSYIKTFFIIISLPLFLYLYYNWFIGMTYFCDLMATTELGKFIAAIVYILLTVLGFLKIARSLHAFAFPTQVDNSPTPVVEGLKATVDPPRPPINGQESVSPVGDMKVSHSASDIAVIVHEWFDAQGKDYLNRGTFRNGFTNIFNYLRYRLDGFELIKGDDWAKQDWLIDIICQTNLFILEGNCLRIIRGQEAKESSLQIFNQEAMK